MLHQVKTQEISEVSIAFNRMQKYIVSFQERKSNDPSWLR